MTNGTSQGLFIVVAIVIFGIFVGMSYTIFGDEMAPALVDLFGDSNEMVSNTLTKTIISNEEYDFIFNKDTQTIVGYIGTSSKVVIPNEISGIKVLGIASNAFLDKELTSIYVPVSVEYIGKGFAANNSKLLKMVLPTHFESAVNLDEIIVSEEGTTTTYPKDTVVIFENQNIKDKVFEVKEVTISDDVLDAKIRESLGLGVEPITNLDLMRLETLDLSNTGVMNLSDLEQAVRLKTLKLNNVSTLKDLDVLSKLPVLSNVDITGTKNIDRISVSNLTNKVGVKITAPDSNFKMSNVIGNGRGYFRKSSYQTGTRPYVESSTRETGTPRLSYKTTGNTYNVYAHYYINSPSYDMYYSTSLSSFNLTDNDGIYQVYSKTNSSNYVLLNTYDDLPTTVTISEDLYNNKVWPSSSSKSGKYKVVDGKGNEYILNLNLVAGFIDRYDSMSGYTYFK